jgi:hypothetical protein
MAKLIGVANADAGAIREFTRVLGRLTGSHACDLLALAHSAVKPRGAWKEMAVRLAQDTGHPLSLVYRNRRSDAQRQASEGREPCVLIQADDGAISMIADWNDLQLAAGDIDSFERILRSKLLMY